MIQDCKKCEFSKKDSVPLPCGEVDGLWCEKTNVFLYPSATKYAKLCRFFLYRKH